MTTARTAPWRTYLPLLALAVLAVYFPLLHGGFLWDDEAYVTGNLALRSLSGLSRIWLKPGAVEQYYPLSYSVFWLEYHLWGLRTFGYHLVNVFFHVWNAFLVGLILTRLRLRGAWLAAFLFALHPVQLESVAWITELKNVLSGFFYLSSLLVFLSHEEKRSPRRLAASVALFTASLLCKSVTCTLPAVLLLLAWARRGRLDRRDWRDVSPFLAVGLAVGGLTLWVEHSVIGASGPEFAFTGAQRLLIAGRALWFYLGKLAWPAPLIFMYPRWSIDPSSAAQWLFPAAALAGLAFLWSARSRLGRWPSAAFLFFAGTLVPALGFVSIYTMRFSFVADHFQYLACLGPLALFAALLSRGLEKLGNRRALKCALLALLFGNLALVDWSEGRKFENAAELWLDTARKDPDSPMAHHHLGVLLAQTGHLDQAETELETAARLDPSLVQTQLALAYVDRQLGRRDAALAAYRQALALGADDPAIAADYEALKRAPPAPKN